MRCLTIIYYCVMIVCLVIACLVMMIACLMIVCVEVASGWLIVFVVVLFFSILVYVYDHDSTF